MQLILNFVWALVAIASVCLWKRLRRRSLANRHAWFIGLFLFNVILFPAISISYDLWSSQGPAIDTLDHRDHFAPCPHSAFAANGACPKPVDIELNFGFQHLGTSLSAPLIGINNPALAPIQSRPPPVA